MKILLAVDGSSYSCKAAEYLTSHLNWLQTAPELYLLHVKLPIPMGRARGGMGQEAIEHYYESEAMEALAPAEQVLRAHNIPFKSTFKVGDIAEEVLSYVTENGIDLIVMGSHGHGAIANLVTGSITTKVLAITTVPVLIVR